MDRGRADADGVLVVDAGDMFLPREARNIGWVAPSADEIARRARLIVAGQARIGLHAFTPGDRDLAIGTKALARLLKDARIPVVSANLTDAAGKRLFDADRIVEVAGLKVGLFGVTGIAPDDRDRFTSWGVKASDPLAAARDTVASLRQRGAQIVVGLLHMPSQEESKKLATAVPGLDWAVMAHSERSLEQPESAGEAHLLEAFTMGKNLGRLDLHVVGGSLKMTDRGQRSQLLTIKADHERQLVDYDRRAAEDKGGRLAEFFKRQKQAIGESLARETKLLDAMPARIEGSWFENRIVPLDTSIADHLGLALLVRQYNDENQRRASAGQPVGIAWRPAPLPGGKTSPGFTLGGHPPAPTAPDGPLRYTGAVACGACHVPERDFWQRTKHASALDALKKVKRDKDPTCIGCHVTGYLRPGGTSDVTLATGRLRDVGCEACHGPGLDHASAQDVDGKTDARKKTTSLKVGEDVCLGCHTPDQTNGAFDYAAFRKAILGPGHGA